MPGLKSNQLHIEMYCIRISNMDKKTLYVVLPILILIVALVVAVSTGYVYIGTKSPQQTVKTPYVVCDENIITSYNNIQSMVTREPGGDEEKKKTEEMKKLVDEVSAKQNYEKDPTCAYMVVSYHVYSVQDVDAAKGAYEKLKEATEKSGVYVDHRVQGTATLNSLNVLIDAYDKSRQSQDQEYAG